jgi:RNA polymerase sigma-70 factor (ECF subfamily)
MKGRMRKSDTTACFGPPDFATTQWSMITAARDGPPDERRQSLDRLVRRYWRAVYAFIRAKWGYGNEESKDLTQNFFVWLMEGNALTQVRKNAGRFRNFLRTALAHFLCNQYRAAKADKRGGNRKMFSIQELSDEGWDAPAGARPEEVMDREWKRILLDQARSLLRNEYLFRGKEAAYKVFDEYYFGGAQDATHEKLAAKHGATPTQANNWLHEARTRFRQLVHDLVAETVTDADGLRQEMAELFGASGLP